MANQSQKDMSSSSAVAVSRIVGRLAMLNELRYELQCREAGLRKFPLSTWDRVNDKPLYLAKLEQFHSAISQQIIPPG